MTYDSTQGNFISPFFVKGILILFFISTNFNLCQLRATQHKTLLCPSVDRFIGRSVPILFFICFCDICPHCCSSNSNTAPTLPHATGVPQYPYLSIFILSSFQLLAKRLIKTVCLKEKIYVQKDCTWPVVPFTENTAGPRDNGLEGT